MISLTACVTVAVPNPEYLKDTPITYLKKGRVTNADITRLAEDREFDVKSANLDKAALRAWFEAQCRGWLRRCKAFDE